MHPRSGCRQGTHCRQVVWLSTKETYRLLYQGKGKPVAQEARWRANEGKLDSPGVASLNEASHHQKLVYLDNTLVYISIVRLKGNEYLIIASYNNQQKAIENYRDRWQVETMFNAFKTNGFNVEDTNLIDI